MPRTADKARSSPVDARIPMGLGDIYVHAGDHVAHFYRDEEWLDLAAGFFGTGLEAGDKCV